jgi:catechol 2,3-dioxygenase-like lactoylglutathione lyase family enzyme
MHLDHVTVRTRDLEAARRFFLSVFAAEASRQEILNRSSRSSRPGDPETDRKKRGLALFRGPSRVWAVGSIVDGGAGGARRKWQRRRMLAGAEDLIVEPFPRCEDLAHMGARP